MLARERNAIIMLVMDRKPSKESFEKPMKREWSRRVLETLQKITRNLHFKCITNNSYSKQAASENTDHNDQTSEGLDDESYSKCDVYMGTPTNMVSARTYQNTN